MNAPLTHHGSSEFAFTDDDFRTLAQLAIENAGIHLPEAKKTLVYSRLAKRVRLLGFQSFAQYSAFVQSTKGQDEQKEMISSLTTNVTRFHREPHHFEHLKVHSLPALLDRASQGERIRLWSAACSSGEEVYGIAIELLKLSPDVARHDIRILGTDIDETMLSKAHAGLYGHKALAHLDPDMRNSFFCPPDRSSGNLQVTDALRRLVTFRYLNLIKPWPVKGPFDVVFCRNVAIYFNEATQKELWAGFARVIRPGGTLFIGHSERLTGEAAKFFEPIGITTFVRTSHPFPHSTSSPEA